MCIRGDFDIDLNKVTFESELLKSLSKQFALMIHIPKENTRKTAIIDHLIKGSGISVEQHQVIPSPSDHKAIKDYLQ